MKKLLYLAMAFMVVFASLHVPAVQAEQASEIKKIPLIYADHIPAMAGGNVFIKKQYLPRIQGQLAKIGYELDITFYHSESLYKYADLSQACDQGLIDITVAVIPYELARAPLNEVMDMSFMGWDGPTMLRVWEGLNKNVPEFRAEWAKDYVELFRFIPTLRLIHHNIEGARVPEDFKGKKIHSAGMGAKLLKSIGAVAIKQNPGDWYTSLDRGLFDGIHVAFDMVGILKLWEVLNYHVIPYGDSFGFTPVTHIMNREKFESLPAGVQQVLLDNMMWASEAMLQDELTRLPWYQEGAKKKGNTFYELTPEETAKWREAVKPVHEEWIKDKEKKGLAARKVYNEARRLVKEYTK